MARKKPAETVEQRALTEAARIAERGMRRGDGGPFGAVVLRRGRLVSVGWNTVLKKKDPTCHAEVNAIRAAARRRRTHDLSGCDLFTTTEPCPMCFSAIHWAGIRSVTYCTTIADVKKLGFNELCVSNQRLKKWGRSPVRIRRAKSDACVALLKKWKQLPHRRTY